MKCLVLLAGSTVAMYCSSLARPSFSQETPEPSPPGGTVELLDCMVRSSQQTWAESMPSARQAIERDPRGVIEHLIAQLAIDEPVAGGMDESQIYNVCGNALTLLERLTDERICGLGRDWVGYSTHDHRGASPSREKIQGPWQAWLEVRADVPVDEWFWGLSYAEFLRVSRPMRRPRTDWEQPMLQAVRELGDGAYPYLLDKLLDDEFAVDGLRYCDQANALLRRLTSEDLGEIERTALLRLDPEEPDRKFRIAVSRNRASMSLMQRRWIAAILGH